MHRATPYGRLIAALMLLLMAGIAGCSTIEGAGDDIEDAGEFVEDTADDVEDELDD